MNINSFSAVNVILKVVVILIFFLAHPLVMFGQNSKEDVVYLKNGSVIRGNITEIKMDEYVLIQISGGSILKYAMAEVDSITKEAAYNSKGDYKYKESGYFNETGFALLFGREANNFYNNSSISVEFHTVNGYQLNKYLRAGVGIGVDYYSNYDFVLSPVYLNIGGDLLKNPVTPFYSIIGGYSFSWDSDIPNYEQDGGRLYGATVGVKFNSRSAASYKIGIGYRNQKATINQQDWWGTGMYQTTYNFRRVALGLEVTF